MNVRLIAISKPVIDEIETADQLIAYAARVSNPTNQSNNETAPRLLAYLIRNKHWSPFEMASMTVEITTTRDIARQILRHRSFSFQEFSQRYAEASRTVVVREARLQDKVNRQNSIQVDDDSLQRWWQNQQEFVAETARKAYDDALQRGVAKEIARAVLPEGLTESKLYMAGTIRSFIHYCDLRCDNGTQAEHREVAVAIKQIIVEQFPSLASSL